MTKTFVTELKSTEARKAMTEVILAIFHQWRLHPINQAELLAVKDTHALNHGEPLPESDETLERAGHIFAIERALSKHFLYELNLRDNWIETNNVKLNNEIPLKVMLSEGLEGIKKVRELAENLH